MLRAFLRLSQIYLVYVSDSTHKPQIIWILLKTQRISENLKRKLKDFSKTQGQNSPNFSKNSRFRKLHYPTPPEKRLKKKPGLRRVLKDCLAHLKISSREIPTNIPNVPPTVPNSPNQSSMYNSLLTVLTN